MTHNYIVRLCKMNKRNIESSVSALFLFLANYSGNLTEQRKIHSPLSNKQVELYDR